MVAPAVPEIYEEDEIFAAVDARTESLQSLRELGPPDLVYLVKQPKTNANRQTGVYHHVTGVDASSSASLAAYVNTLTFSPLDKTHKVVSGIYWSETRLNGRIGTVMVNVCAAVTMPSRISICVSK
jgi:hypothetical protein